MNLAQENKNILYSANFEICKESGLIKTGSDSIRLGPVNMRVLMALLDNNGQVVSRAQIFDKVWNKQVVSDDTLTRCISDLRTQLGRYSVQAKLIETIPKRGYRWLPKVTEQSIEIAKVDHLGNAPSALASNKRWMNMAKWMLGGILVLFLASTLLIWSASHLMNSKTVRVALLPIQIEHTEQKRIAIKIEELLKEHLLATENIRFLSSRTIEGNRQNLYPYLSREFAAEWIIEGRIRESSQSLKITLNLVDARTALVYQSFTREFDQRQANLAEMTQSLVNDLENKLTPSVD